MDYQNLTPFPSLAFDAVNTLGEEFHVAVLRMTLRIDPEGELRIAPEQEPLLEADVFYGEMHRSSVKQESDLAPYKPWCDVIVIGDAHAPGRKPMKRFEAGVRISRKGQTVVNKHLTVTGPRYWQNRLARGWKLTEPGPIQSLPLRYEYAYGGESRVEATDPAARKLKTKFKLTPEQRSQHPDGPENAPVAHQCAPMNPLGRGYAAPWYLQAKKLKRIPAPQIESPFDPVKKFGKAYIPQGLGVVGRAWSPRVGLAGTLDDAFIKSGRSLPEDFDFAYWNGAHSDLQVPWLQGEDIIDLINIPIADYKADRLDSQGNRISRLVLPTTHLCALATLEDGSLYERDFQIDTLVIDAHQRTAGLTYRLKHPAAPKVQSIHVEQLSSAERQVLLDHVEAVNAQVTHYQEIPG